MSQSYRALCTDFYVNIKLALKMDLPRDRQTTLDLFDRIRREHAMMNQFRRYREELALESPAGEHQQWLAVRQTNVRAGFVNPPRLADAYKFHASVLDVVPFFLSISPLDIDNLEVLYGFDLAAEGNHDAIVYHALMAGTAHAGLGDIAGAEPLDCQPVLGVRLGEPAPCDAYFEVKTRSTTSRHDRERDGGEPISVYVTLRRAGPFDDVKNLPGVFRELSERGEELVESKVIPQLVGPIREAIGAS